LTKQYLTRQRKLTSREELKGDSVQIREWVHVIATDKVTYELRYFNVNNDEEEEADEE
jgi:large subunit ribosomal protein L22e